jgi:hypothetical protein
MRCRILYVRIEKLPGYSPAAPENGEHGKYGRDCMRMHGHEDGRIPQAEIERRRLNAVVYREYLDSGYTVPNTAPLAAQDVTEPRWDQRIPGCVLYAEPNERLHIHVRNDDTEPHTFHLHGLIYGIDSDGSWPFGVTDGSGHRSDAICPGDEWCYVFDVTNETVGCWPFHDHLMDIQAAVDRWLFGGLVVRHPAGPKPDLEVPFFLHRLVGSGGEPAFDSGSLNGGDVFSHNVAIVDSPTPRFLPDDVTIGVNGTVTWTHGGTMPYTVSDAATSPLDSMAINGRAFVGNTPIIVATAGRGSGGTSSTSTWKSAGTTCIRTGNGSNSRGRPWTPAASVQPSPSAWTRSSRPSYLTLASAETTTTGTTAIATTITTTCTGTADTPTRASTADMRTSATGTAAVVTKSGIACAAISSFTAMSRCI